LRGKYLTAAIRHTEMFAEAVPCSLESLTGAMVQRWIEDLIRPTDGSKGLLPASVSKMIKGPRAYWEWMQANGHVSDERKPFSGRRIRDHRDAYAIMEAEVQPFEPADVTRLLVAAGDDRDLVAIIRISAGTGMRLEEVASLTIDQVRVDPASGIQFLFEAGRKTRSAIRNVPVPSALAGLIDDLVANATPEGYLIHDGRKDKNGHSRRSRWETLQRPEDQARIPQAGVLLPLAAPHRDAGDEGTEDRHRSVLAVDRQEHHRPQRHGHHIRQVRRCVRAGDQARGIGDDRVLAILRRRIVARQ
jgi:site-specific recombinase XerD